MVQSSAHDLKVVSLILAHSSFLVRGAVLSCLPLQNHMICSYLVPGDYLITFILSRGNKYDCTSFSKYKSVECSK